MAAMASAGGIVFAATTRDRCVRDWPHPILRQGVVLNQLDAVQRTAAIIYDKSRYFGAIYPV